MSVPGKPAATRVVSRSADSEFAQAAQASADPEGALLGDRHCVVVDPATTCALSAYATSRDLTALARLPKPGDA